jgi:hypothetical protein
MDNTISATAQAPRRALVRSGLVMTDLVAVPLLGVGMAGVLGLALTSLAIAAGGVNFVLGLRFLDFFPVFPVVARILSGLSALAFAALLAITTLSLARLFRGAWRRFWSWHGSAWAGVFAAPTANAAEHGQRAWAFVRLIRILGFVFLGLFAVTVSLMFALAAGPFWHVWGWFVR